MRVLLVTNEASGSAGSIDPEAVLAAHACDVTRIDVAEAASHGGDSDVDRVVVAGGDGSIGSAARVASRLDVPLGVVPAGTANDFARALRLPDDPEAACVLAATGTNTRAIDLADLDGTPFVNVASLGIAPRAAEQAHGLKRHLRALAYPVGAAVAAARARPVSLVASVDGAQVWSGEAWQAMVASTGAFGGWADTGATRDGDGALDLVIVPAGRGTRRLAQDAAALLQGALAEREGVHHERGARIELVLRDTPQMVVDGELVDIDDRHVTATVVERPLQVVVA